MKVFKQAKRISVLAILMVAVVSMSACGKKAPVPAPPPPPALPNPGYGGGFAGGGCGSVGGQSPLNQLGYVSSLQAVYSGGSAANALQLFLSYQTYPNAGSQMQNIVGSGTFSYPDLNLLSRGMQVPQTSFCVSSAGPTGGVTPGVYMPRSGEVSILLQGLIQVPSYPGFGGVGYYGGGYPQYVQQIVQLAIGYSQGCSAYLYNDRVVGCADVYIGSGSQPIRYQLR